MTQCTSQSLGRRQIDAIAAEGVAQQAATWAESLQRHKAKSAELQKLRLEEMQKLLQQRRDQ